MSTMTDEERRVVTERVALEIMGWHKEQLTTGWPFVESSRPTVGTYWVDDKQNIKFKANEFKPLTDHNHTALVVEAMARKEWSFQLAEVEDSDGEPRWRADFLHKVTPRLIVYRTRATVCEAVLEAALAALAAGKEGA